MSVGPGAAAQVSVLPSGTIDTVPVAPHGEPGFRFVSSAAQVFAGVLLSAPLGWMPRQRLAPSPH